jgi:hypothetical protein
MGINELACSTTEDLQDDCKDEKKKEPSRSRVVTQPFESLCDGEAELFAHGCTATGSLKPPSSTTREKATRRLSKAALGLVMCHA